MLLRLQLVPNQVLQRLGVDRALQLPSLDLLDVASHVLLDRQEGGASQHIEQGGHGFGGLEELGGRNGIVGLDVDVVERLLAVKVGA